MDQRDSGSWHQTILTAKPRDLVFDYISDFTRHTEWDPGLVDVERQEDASEGRRRYKLRYRDPNVKSWWRRSLPGGFREIQVELKVSVHPEVLSWRETEWDAEGLRYYQTIEVVLSEEEHATRLTWKSDVARALNLYNDSLVKKPPHGLRKKFVQFFYKLIAPMLEREARRVTALSQALDGLKLDK